MVKGKNIVHLIEPEKKNKQNKFCSECGEATKKIHAVKEMPADFKRGGVQNIIYMCAWCINNNFPNYKIKTRKQKNNKNQLPLL